MTALTRRRLGAGLVFTLAAGAAARVEGAPPLFLELPRVIVPPHLQRLTTAGHGRHGVGAASYRRCAPGPATLYRTLSADGACWELADLQVTPEQAGAAGDGDADDRPALMAAQALARPLTLTPGRAYRVGATMPLSVPVSGRGRLLAARGFRGDVLIHGHAGLKLQDLEIDGAGLPRPRQRWSGVGAPVGCAIFLEGAPGAPLDQPALDGVTIRNTPGGGVMIKYAQGVRIQGFTAEGVQTQRDALTNAVVELYRVDDGLITDSAIRGYGWKGFSLGACKRTVGRNCTAEGGSPGHAAHYVDDCEDTGFEDCSHSGAGYAAKASNARRAWFRGYSAKGSAGGVQIQSCHDVEITGVVIADTAGPGLVVSSSTAGPMDGCHIEAAQVSWSAAPTVNQVGLMLTANGAKDSAVTGVVVRGLSISGGYFGIDARAAATCDVSLDLQDVRIDGSAQYGMILYARDVAVRGAQIRGPSGFPAIALYGNDGAPGGDVALVDLTLSGGAGRAALIEVGDDSGRAAAFASLTVSGARALGGRSLLKARLTAAAGAAPPTVDLEDNVVFGLATPDGIDVGFADGLTARVQARGNRLLQAGGALGVMRIGPRAAVAAPRLSRNQADVRIS
ncbi:right-handed parallel beta-helix repeat-containing protein [Caulobacter sp. KR2-114]|uniref:right-handed parallel beta-helix repeat-containing protein n=1 Tax=Caulobacter sp. KR2-114 TaxID=3400912 RepID=UPI003BFAAA1B